MKDQFGQRINHMNISVTEDCNLCCRYCRPEEGLTPIPEEDVMTKDDFLKVVKAATTLGIRSFTIMGGEPVLWESLFEFIKELKEIPDVEHVTLQTNGLLVCPLLPDLQEAGIDEISIHMDTTQSQQYKKLTRGKISSAEAIKPVWQSVAKNMKTTILCVLQKEVITETVVLAGLAKYYPIDVKFVEIRPIRWCHEAEPCTKEEILERVKISYPDLEETGEEEFSDGTVFYKSSKLKGRIGMMNDGKNVLHLSNTGLLSRGFGEKDGCNLIELLKGNGTEVEIKAAIKKFVMFGVNNVSYTTEETN